MATPKEANLNQFTYTLEQDTVTVYGSADIGSSGAVSGSGGLGISSVTKLATAGKYEINLKQVYARFLHADIQVIDDAISQITKVQIFQDPTTMSADIKSGQKLTIQCLAPTSASDTALVAANPASGARINFKLVFRRSKVGPADR
jgi:hypothetical protein